MTDFRNSRESVEALEGINAAARISRDSVEALWNIFVAFRNSRSSVEGLWQQPLSTLSMRNSRLSLEVLEGPILSHPRWGSVRM